MKNTQKPNRVLDHQGVNPLKQNYKRYKEHMAIGNDSVNDSI